MRRSSCPLEHLDVNGMQVFDVHAALIEIPSLLELSLRHAGGFEAHGNSLFSAIICDNFLPKLRKITCDIGDENCIINILAQVSRPLHANLQSISIDCTEEELEPSTRKSMSALRPRGWILPF
jgi:hypothetical protein